jgi:predicted extracellular nuclease
MKSIIVILVISSCVQCMYAQENRYRIMFYNVENLFDIYNDSLTADDDFTPAGKLHWTSGRFRDKVNKISKVITAAGEWQAPDVIGLCEVENLFVLNRLIYDTPLAEKGYQVIHHDSPDERGIDVALLYRNKRIRIVKSSFIPVKYNDLITRDILKVIAIMDSDTITLFVNHWPSRSAGQLETDDYRMAAAKTLRNAVDSVFRVNSSAKIIIMGDFNDEPVDESLVNGLRAIHPVKTGRSAELINLSVAPGGMVKGTLKYQGNWNLFDQIIVSGGLITGKGLKTNEDAYHVFYVQAMLETDATYNGVKPFRTYQGFRYAGGYSDHLPVYIDIVDTGY